MGTQPAGRIPGVPIKDPPGGQFIADADDFDF
jgi:hypothetical protein